VTPLPVTLSLFGIKVPTEDYEAVKHIARVLVGKTRSGSSLSTAKKKCVRIAMRAVAEARAI
jgi:hypothetical protein